MRFDYLPVKAFESERTYKDGRQGDIVTEVFRVVAPPNRIEIVYQKHSAKRLGYLIFLGLDVHAISVDGTNLGSVEFKTRKNQLAMRLLEYANLKRELAEQRHNMRH